MVFEIFNLNRYFYYLFNKVTVAQLIERLAGELKDPISYHGLGEFFSLEFILNEEMNQMVQNKNNTSNSLVFDRWPQTKICSSKLFLFTYYQ